MPAPLHDADFFRWTMEQAAALRSMPRSNVLDSDNLAEEIEDMGRAALNKVASLLTQVLTHLLKLAIDPAAPAREHWVDEILASQADARRAFSPGMASAWRLPSCGTMPFVAPLRPWLKPGGPRSSCRPIARSISTRC